MWASLYNAFDIMTETREAVMRVVGPAPAGGQFLEVILDEQPLRAAMYRFSANILFVSFLILLITGPLLYLTLHHWFVRPMRRLTANLVAFHADPENPGRIIAPSNSRDEIGIAERELSSMQRDLVSMLNQKNRLAALGLVVAKHVGPQVALARSGTGSLVEGDPVRRHQQAGDGIHKR